MAIDKTNEKSVKSKGAFVEKGRPGERLIESFDKTERRVDTLTLKDYRNMLNDGQVFMLWNALTTIILSAGLKVVDDPEWEGEDDSPEKKFIEKNLLSPSWKGGMTTPIQSINRIMLRAFAEGYRLFEAVYKVADDGFIMIDKLAPRAGTDDTEVKILTDDNGEFIGFWQRSMFGDKHLDVKVKNDGPLLKAVKSTYGAEFGSLYGRPGLKGAWYHYDKAHKIMFISNVGVELGTIGYIHAQGNLTPESRTELLQILAKPHMQNYLYTDENSVTLEVLKLTDPGVMREAREMINLHYSLVAKSMLAQFTDLGSSMSNTGSRSLGESQVDFFKEGLQAMAETLIEEPWNKVIAGLIKANFGSDIYPTLAVNEIQDESAANIYAAFLEFVKKGEVPDSIRTEILVQASNEMGIEVNKDEVLQEIEEQRQKDMERETALIEAKKNQPAMSNSPKEANFADIEDDMEFTTMRPLYPDEQKLKLVAIKRKLTDGRVQAELTMRTQLDDQQEDIIDSYLAQLNGGRKTTLNLADTQDLLYSEELEALAFELMEFGKVSAANELNVSVPTTTKKDRQQLIDEVKLIVGDQQARLDLRLQAVVNNAKTGKIPQDQVEAMLIEEYNTFFDRVLAPTLSSLMPKALNWGRRATFEANKDKIWGYRYTAVLDANTTNYCRKLDGKILQETDPDYYMLQPPNHFGCRSIYTPITNSEQTEYGFKSDGKPDDVPVYSSVSTFKDVRLSDAVEEEIRSVLGLDKE